MYSLKKVISKIKFTIIALLLVMASSFSSQGRTEVMIDVPAPNSVHTGVGIIHGWSDGSQQLRVFIDGKFLTNARADSIRADVSSNSDTGYAVAFNYNLLEPGGHTVEVIDAMTKERRIHSFRTIRVDEKFLHDKDVFPLILEPIRVILGERGHKTVTLGWDTSTQTFQIIDVQSPATQTMTQFQRESLAEVNRFRSSGTFCHEVFYPSVPDLAWDSRLADAARKHASYLFEINVLQHSGRGGSSPGQRIEAEGVAHRGWAENAHALDSDARDVVQSYIDDVGVNPPGHCTNIMNPTLTHMGTAKIGKYSVQNFIVKK